KLLQIILIGQPELRDVLDRPEMRQIAQRITGRYHLEPLDGHDTRAYVNHRLRVAGAQSDIFTKSAIRALHRQARGIPRLINVIADRALLAAYTQDRRNVDTKLVGAAAAEVFGIRRRRTPWWPAATAAAGVLALLFGVTNLRETPAPAVLQQEPQVLLGATPSAPSPVVERLVASSTNERAVELGVAAADPGTDEQQRASPATLQSLLADPEFVVDTDRAIAELLALWGARYDPARGDPCEQAVEQGLRCLFQRRGTLSELRRVDWPTILSLVGPDGREHPVVVSSLGYDHARLVANGRTFELPLAELSFYWYGDHLLLWRPGDAPGTDLAPGDDDVGVRWLRATLASLAGETPPSDGSTLYDDSLERRVRAYQESHQLVVDGIVGVRTQVAMVAELDLPDTPSLIEEH
ncbi:MAG TPA: peptidoglycan-binding protein, partial [Gammaproteobacteria bacterium]